MISAINSYIFLCLLLTRMTSTEVTEALKDAPAKNGKLDIKKFVHMIKGSYNDTDDNNL